MWGEKENLMKTVKTPSIPTKSQYSQDKNKGNIGKERNR